MTCIFFKVLTQYKVQCMKNVCWTVKKNCVMKLLTDILKPVTFYTTML